ncbi:MAG TPA: hypothetical protein VFI02_11845, partial [Armatimonadota bacterium]|nr:hypothetical protein [Armatimonadota bacterium]
HIVLVRRNGKSIWCSQSYPDLRGTTMKTILEWIPEKTVPGYSMQVKHSPPMEAKLTMRLEDDSTVEAEFLFLALDSDDDVRKLKSLELTGVWINEAGEIPFSIFKMARGRTMRYPSPRLGGYNWTGVIMDTNPPTDDSWWYEIFETERPKGYESWQQPPALVKGGEEKGKVIYVPNNGNYGVAAAENVQNHNEGFNYWLNLIGGSDEEWIKVFVMGQYGNSMGGRPIYTGYRDDVHCPKEEIEPLRGIPLLLGWDASGLTPAVVFCQISPRGQLLVIDEICTGLTKNVIKKMMLPPDRYFEDMDIRSLARDIVKPYLVNRYTGMPFTSIGDPAGAQRSPTDSSTCLQELAEAGIPTEGAMTNLFFARRRAVIGYIERMVNGEPGILVSRRCKILRKGFQGAYRFRQKRFTAGEVTADEAEKNFSSHPHDGLQYVAVHVEKGGGSKDGHRNVSSQRRPEIRRHNMNAFT